MVELIVPLSNFKKLNTLHLIIIGGAIAVIGMTISVLVMVVFYEMIFGRMNVFFDKGVQLIAVALLAYATSLLISLITTKVRYIPLFIMNIGVAGYLTKFGIQISTEMLQDPITSTILATDPIFNIVMFGSLIILPLPFYAFIITTVVTWIKSVPLLKEDSLNLESVPPWNP